MMLKFRRSFKTTTWSVCVIWISICSWVHLFIDTVYLSAGRLARPVVIVIMYCVITPKVTLFSRRSSGTGMPTWISFLFFMCCPIHKINRELERDSRFRIGFSDRIIYRRLFQSHALHSNFSIVARVTIILEGTQGDDMTYSLTGVKQPQTRHL